MSRVVADRYAAVVLGWLAFRDVVSLGAMALADALFEIPHGTVYLVLHAAVTTWLATRVWGGRDRRPVLVFFTVMALGQPLWSFLVDPVSLQTFATLLQGAGVVLQVLAARRVRASRVR